MAGGDSVAKPARDDNCCSSSEKGSKPTWCSFRAPLWSGSKFWVCCLQGTHEVTWDKEDQDNFTTPSVGRTRRKDDKRTLLQYLSLYIANNQKDWDQWIPLFLLAYRSSRHETTQHTPSLVLMGHELRLPLDLWRGPTPAAVSDEDTFTGDTRKRLAEIHKFVRQRMHLCSDRMKSWYDTYSQPISFVPGEQVWLFYPRRTKGKCPKLQSNWECNWNCNLIGLFVHQKQNRR